MDERKHILVVDDDVMNLNLARRLLESQYKVSIAKSGYSALDFLHRTVPDIILLDISMPGMDGITTFQRIKEEKKYDSVPVVFLTACMNGEIESQCFKLGAADFITKPFFGPTVISRIERILELIDLRRELEQKVKSKTKQVEGLILQLIVTIANVVDAKNVYSQGHSTRVAVYAEEIAKRLNWSQNEINNLHYCALLHDVGKINIADNIINKEGTYSTDDYNAIRQHTTMGAEILKDVVMLENVSDCALYHHERYDGTGYNQGLRGDSIPIVARIVSIADAYDAMSSRRSYRNIMSKEEIIYEFSRERGKQFDPKLTDIMLDIIKSGVLDDENISKRLDITNIGEESGILLQKVVTAYNKGMLEIASTDGLTGLWNRKTVENMIDDFLADKENDGFFMMMDIDDFKHINDTYGHITGDDALKKFAKVLSEITTDAGVAARIGGDEFVIFIKDITDKKAIEEFAANIKNRLLDEVIADNPDEKLHTSIGITIAGKDGKSFRELYTNADKSLYYIKQNGKNSFHFYS